MIYSDPPGLASRETQSLACNERLIATLSPMYLHTFQGPGGTGDGTDRSRGLCRLCQGASRSAWMHLSTSWQGKPGGAIATLTDVYSNTRLTTACGTCTCKMKTLCHSCCKVTGAHTYTIWRVLREPLTVLPWASNPSQGAPNTQCNYSFLLTAPAQHNWEGYWGFVT